MLSLHALHTIDKFHVKKLLLDGMDEVRRMEQKAQRSKALNLGRRVLMIPENKQTTAQKEKTAMLCK